MGSGLELTLGLGLGTLEEIIETQSLGAGRGAGDWYMGLGFFFWNIYEAPDSITLNYNIETSNNNTNLSASFNGSHNLFLQVRVRDC